MGHAFVFRNEGPDQLRGAVLHGKRKQGDSLLLRLKAWVKNSPTLFSVLSYIAAAFIGKTAKRAISHLPSDSVILNIGSGVRQVRPGVINIDYDHFPGVSVMADVHMLPFQDNSVDAITAESLLEHVTDPSKLVAEMRRVLKPGGLLYIVTPFMLGYHASPHDYYRWTEYGMVRLLQGFSMTESGSAWGPTVAAASIVGSWLSLLLSFGISPLYQIWSIFFLFLFGPFTYLDFLIGLHPRAKDIAHGIYFISHKQ